jgi:DNA-binding NarL/FixJ family response regulator
VAGESLERTPVSDDPARVSLVDDQAVFREALAVALEREPDMVVGLAGKIAEARTCLAGTPANVAVIALDLLDGSGLDLIQDLRHKRLLVQVLVLTANPDRFASVSWKRSRRAPPGAPEASVPAQIVTAVRRLCAGQPPLDPAELMRALHLAARYRTEQRRRAALSRLSARERETLVALAHSMNDKEIAHFLCIRHETVGTHMVNHGQPAEQIGGRVGPPGADPRHQARGGMSRAGEPLVAGAVATVESEAVSGLKR